MRVILLLIVVLGVIGCGTSEKADTPAYPPGEERPAT